MDDEHPRLLRGRQWTDPGGTQWRMRGAPLDQKQARRLLRRDGVRVLLINSPKLQLVEGNDLEELLSRLEEFWADRAQPMADFALGDFRNDGHEVLVVVQESC